MLRTLTLKNIRGFVEATIDLTPLTVFVGTNGSGKSTVLECLDSLCRHQRALVRQVMPQPLPTFEGRLASANLITRGASKASVTGASNDAASELEYEPQRATLVTRHPDPLPRPMLLRLAPESLAATSYLKEPDPTLESDGGGLASVLDYLIGLRDSSIERIEEDLRVIVPQARRLRVIPERIEIEEVIHTDNRDWEGSTRLVKKWQMGSRFELEYGKMGYLPATALSEGTLIVIGLLTAIHRESGPTLALLDDLDRGLHPTAQANLIKSLRALVDRRGDLQIVCTTHSSYALDAFSADEVHVTWVDASGIASHRKLSEHPEWPQWKSVMDAGEFWSTVGERWVGETVDPT